MADRYLVYFNLDSCLWEVADASQEPDAPQAIMLTTESEYLAEMEACGLHLEAAQQEVRR